MGSLYLNRLEPQQWEELIKKLLDTQHYNCFICGNEIDLTIHKSAIDLDHVIPLKLGGKDDPFNFAITHSSCNRTKQDADMRVARLLFKFDKIAEKTLRKKNKTPNLSDIFEIHKGARYKLNFSIKNNTIKISLE